MRVAKFKEGDFVCLEKGSNDRLEIDELMMKDGEFTGNYKCILANTKKRSKVASKPRTKIIAEDKLKLWEDAPDVLDIMTEIKDILVQRG